MVREILDLARTVSDPRDSGSTVELSEYVPWACTRGRGAEDRHF